MIAMIRDAVPVVHMVYENEYLMERDQEDFKGYWDFLDCTDRVLYHSNIGFNCDAGDLLIVDEADSIIFKDPAAFMAVVDRNPCICFTATPSEEKLEAKILDLLKFHRIIYPSDKQVRSTELVESLAIIDATTDEKLLAVIK